MKEFFVQDMIWPVYLMLTVSYRKILLTYFQNDKVIAVGGYLLVKRKDTAQIEVIEFCEYMRIFQLSRKIFAKLNAHCLVSEAFGVFSKSILLEIDGYDTDIVGKDMDLVLRLQDCDCQYSKN